ncbi:MAG: hypothetical protein M5R36_21810 [Deltaproteobacteria bacterium]|nr:hypothetical protein [Deltaproteobacteria bacterium]
MRAYEPLSYEDLPAQVRNVLPPDAAPAVRLAAARGNLPFVTQDLVASLYFLTGDADPQIRGHARKTLLELPETLKLTALSSDLHPKILHWFAHHKAGDREYQDRILLNRATADETFVHIAASSPEPASLEMIAQSEERILRAPEILEALFNNPRAPVSSVQRAAEFFRLQTGRDYYEALRAAGPRGRRAGGGDFRRGT